MPVRIAKIILVATVAVWGLWGGLGNLIGYASGYEQVRDVISMQSLEQPMPWALQNPIFAHLGFAFIWALKLIGGAMCALGAIRMWRCSDASADVFQTAKTWAIVGCAMIFFMMFAGFNLLASNVFMAFRSPAIGAIELSWVFAGEVGLVLLFLAMRE
ncbi:MAG: DUF2165 family protein [Kordiimonadaceae bacterium]|nr:DUF2165 family protein [Kordiimonadaceae bacterium]MBO6567139.1 DUF2165 family protein [Kordiimonadaceae bacterium]MBO6963646.1 DUF2165 family protein [Kordiimonadaceae bacterium]